MALLYQKREGPSAHACTGAIRGLARDCETSAAVGIGIVRILPADAETVSVGKDADTAIVDVPGASAGQTLGVEESLPFGFPEDEEIENKRLSAAQHLFLHLPEFAEALGPQLGAGLVGFDAGRGPEEIVAVLLGPPTVEAAIHLLKQEAQSLGVVGQLLHPDDVGQSVVAECGCAGNGPEEALRLLWLIEL